MKIFYNNVFKNYFLLMVTLFATEIIFRVVVSMVVPVIELPLLDWAVLRIFVGINIISLILAVLFSFCGRIAGNILSFITTLVATVYAIAQAGFVNYLGDFMSLGTSSQAGKVKDYIADYLGSFSWEFWLIAIPLVAMAFFYLFIDRRIKVLERNDTIDFADKFDSEERKQDNDKLLVKKKKRRVLNGRINALVFIVVFVVCYWQSLTAGFMQNDLQLKSTKELFFYPDMPTIAVGQFGYSVYAGIDILTILNPPVVNDKSIYDDKYEIHEQVISDYTRYVDDSLWKKIIDEEKNANYKKLHNYYISQEITDKNDFTGFFKGKNLIVIMMESTNNIVINEEYFPNVYKLYNEGWAWDNNYSPRNSCSTGNNEMSGMVALYTINNYCTANAYKNNVYPHAIFNLFNNAGYTTSSYHNYTEQYYARKTIHPNMGSGGFYGAKELGIPYVNVYQEWPSDVELVNKVLEKTENQEQYMVWLTSVTAHQPYTQSSEFGDMHVGLFEGTNYNTSLKRYLSKLKEFDNAIGALLTGLEKQGKLDDTVIVLYSDHYPYGLTNSTLNSYFDYDVSYQNNVDKTPFIIYNTNIHAQKYDEYTSYMNIVPTIANLFDLDYDPRLYAGKDLLSSTYENRVVFANGSWKDDVAYYNAVSGKISYHDQNNSYTTEQVKQINEQIKNRISMSNLAIKVNYFNYLYEAREKHVITENEETTASS